MLELGVFSICYKNKLKANLDELFCIFFKTLKKS